MALRKLRVAINGTAKNPFEIWGLKQNPFPQVAKYELAVPMRELNSLGGEQVKSKDDIAARLKHWSKEFVSLCQQMYRPGEVVRFSITYDTKWE